MAQIILQADDDDGFQEKTLPKHSHEYNVERELGPRFAKDGSFEFDYGTKWKAPYELKRQKEEALKVEMKMEESKLIAQMEFSRYEHETEALREELRKKEAARDQQKSLWSIKEKYMDDIMKQEQEKQRFWKKGYLIVFKPHFKPTLRLPRIKKKTHYLCNRRRLVKC